LKAVYYPDGDVLSAGLGSHPSQVWRSIIEGRDALKIGLIRRIGDERSTDAWVQNWLPRDERLRPVAPRKADAPQMVSDYIHHHIAAWNTEKLEEYFLPMDVEIIRNIPLCTRFQDDFWSWHFENNGQFSVRSCYRALAATKRVREDWLDGNSAASDTTKEEKAWSKLWKISVPSKIRLFLWRLAKHSIPTEDIRHHRQMAPTPACSICGLEDSWRHSLIECNPARCVWALTAEDITEHIAMSTEPTAKQWLFHMIESMGKDDLTRMLVTLWAIWHAKRKAVHEDIYQSPMATMGFVNNFLSDLAAVREEDQLQQRKPAPVPRQAAWIAPPEGRSKINVDAAVAKSEAKGAVAAVCRASNGTYLGASAMVYEGITDPRCLEALACREALDIADDLLVGPVQVASDCLEVVNALHSDYKGYLGSIIMEIKGRSRDRGFTSLCHERRECNVEAHRLARFASSLPAGRFLWLLEPPPGLDKPVILESI
jgi:ribonuclease HI